MARRHAQPTGPARDLCLKFEAEPEAVRAALGQVRLDLAPLGMGVDVTGTLELILAEVLNNIVEHAYQWQGGAITLRLGAGDASVWCEVCDHGAPMPGGHLPVGAPATIDCRVDDLPEGGFGWHLIRSLALDLIYQRDGDTNRLSFSLQRAAPQVVV